MIDKIFTIESQQIVITPDCLLIPELKAVVDNYKDNIAALSYCAYLVSPKSPYSDLDKDSKEEVLLKDYPGDYNVTDEIICRAIDKLELLYTSTTINYFNSIKILVDNVALYARTALIDDSKETGNIQHLLKMMDKCGTHIEQFRKLEEAKDSELKTRGNHILAYDQ